MGIRFAPRRHEEHEERGDDWGYYRASSVMQSPLAYVLSDVLHAKTRRRKDNGNVSSRELMGNHEGKTLPSLLLLRALRGLRGETLDCGQRLLLKRVVKDVPFAFAIYVC